jgi:Tol biopolymer transport system component
LSRLGAALADRYRIERELGQGGMATVYLAHDLRHDRDVAIKVLHADLGAALGPERFLSEIRTTARLQHPHILPLLDSGEADGLLYYVMPLVTGETLRSRLERERQLPVDDAVRIAREVADALHYAHSHSVIHRDIKPENILLQDGHALVADFGIALAVQQAGGQRMTQTGLSLGTPQYMSPEQAMGERSIDARSDLYALAAVTYEMLVGEAPFTGPSVQAIVARVMTEEPRGLTIQRKAIPDHVEDAVLRGLEKLPADRFATAAEFATAMGGGTIAGRSATTRHTAARAAAARARWRDPVVLASAAIALGAVAWALWSRTRVVTSEAPVVSFAMPLTETGSLVLGYSSLGISRDGQLLVYPVQDGSQRRVLAIRRIDGLEEQLLPGTEDASHPIFSPDGESVAFIRGNQLFRVSLSGGAPRSLGVAPGTFVGMTWAPDGRIILSGNTGLFALSENGGSALPLALPDTARGERFFLAPVVSADGGLLFYSSVTEQNVASAKLAVLPLDGGRQTIFDLQGLNPVGILDGVLVYVNASGALMGVPIDAAKRRLTGDPVQLIAGVRFNQTTGIARVAMSDNGTLIYERGSQQSMVVLAGPDAGAETLLAEPQDYAFPRLSPDGSTLAVTVGQGGRRDVWLYNLRTGSPTRLTTDGTTNERQEWSPDGSRVLYRTDRQSTSNIWWRTADLSDTASLLVGGTNFNTFEAVISPDGQFVAFQVDTIGADILYQRIGDSVRHPIAANPNAIEHMPRISPDGKWIAFVTDESGQEAVVVQPFPGPGGRVQVSTGSGAQPVWSRDGERIIYRSGGWFIAARVERTPSFVVVSRDTLIPDDFVYATNPHANYDVAPDGRLVVLQPLGDGQRVVVSNWRRTLDSVMTAAGPR